MSSCLNIPLIVCLNSLRRSCIPFKALGSFKSKLATYSSSEKAVDVIMWEVLRCMVNLGDVLVFEASRAKNRPDMWPTRRKGVGGQMKCFSGQSVP